MLSLSGQKEKKEKTMISAQIMRVIDGCERYD